jgi:hypothetical protein
MFALTLCVHCLSCYLCSFPSFVFSLFLHSFLSSVKRYRMRRKCRWMGAWIFCVDCNVKEFKWGILERVLLLLRNFIFVHLTKTNTHRFMHTHTQNVCKELPLSCRYFPWIRLLVSSLPGSCLLRLYVSNYSLSKDFDFSVVLKLSRPQ